MKRDTTTTIKTRVRSVFVCVCVFVWRRTPRTSATMYTVYRANAYIDFRTKLVWFLNPLHSPACTYYNDNIYFYLLARKRRKPTCRHISTDCASTVTLYNGIAQNTPVSTVILCFNIIYYYLLYTYTAECRRILYHK